MDVHELAAFLLDESKETDTGCLEGSRPLTKGYPVVSFLGRNERAGRVVLYATHGMPLPDEEMLHRCNNPACIRPEHLRWGTRAENAQQRSREGRNGKTARRNP